MSMWRFSRCLPSSPQQARTLKKRIIKLLSDPKCSISYTYNPCKIQYFSSHSQNIHWNCSDLQLFGNCLTKDRLRFSKNSHHCLHKLNSWSIFMKLGWKVKDWPKKNPYNFGVDLNYRAKTLLFFFYTKKRSINFGRVDTIHLEIW